MTATRLLSLPLPLTYAAVAACVSVPANASSPTVVQHIDRSAIASYDRTLRASSILYGPGRSQQSTAFLIDNGNDAAPALLVASGHAVDERPDIVAERLAGRGSVIFEAADGAVFRVAHIRYTSQRGLDFSVLELQQTQGRSRHWV